MITKNRVDIRKSAEEDSKSLFLKGEHMKTIIHDLDKFYDSLFKSKYENVIHADGKYAPCQGCFGCWTKHPAQCYLKDPLKMVCRLIGKTDELDSTEPDASSNNQNTPDMVHICRLHE